MSNKKSILKRKILLIGSGGQLGTECQRTLSPLGDIRGVDRVDVDLTNPNRLRPLIKTFKPDLIFNASAYTAVDEAETAEGSIRAQKINADACRVMAEEAKALNALLVHFSTDYVFDGTKGAPYVEDDALNPLNVYGRTKLEGEKAIQDVGGRYLVFRTSWVYTKRPSSFVGKVLNWARNQNELRIVDDQVGSPTWAGALAEISAQACLVAFLRGAEWIQNNLGVYHLGGRGLCSRKEWAEAIIELDPKKEEHLVEKILPAKTSDYPTRAQRPLNSALNCSKFEGTFGLSLQDWKSALKLCLAMPLFG